MDFCLLVEVGKDEFTVAMRNLFITHLRMSISNLKREFAKSRSGIKLNICAMEHTSKSILPWSAYHYHHLNMYFKEAASIYR